MLTCHDYTTHPFQSAGHNYEKKWIRTSEYWLSSRYVEDVHETKDVLKLSEDDSSMLDH